MLREAAVTPAHQSQAFSDREQYSREPDPYRSEKIVARSKRIGGKIEADQQSPESITHRIIVIDDRYTHGVKPIRAGTRFYAAV